jgi:hypothetical protein
MKIPEAEAEQPGETNATTIAKSREALAPEDDATIPPPKPP